MFKQVNANGFHGLTLHLVNGHMSNCKGNWRLCKVNGHFKWFAFVVMCGMLTIFPACVPPMICVTIILHAKHQMIKRVPLQSFEVASKFLNKITRTLTLRAKQCGGILARVMVLRNFMLITIAWSSFVSTKSADKNTCLRSGTTSAI